MEPIIKVDHVTFEYRDGESVHTAVKDLSLTVEKGSFTVILGHNGSGKSTLARLLNGLNRPTAGKVTVGGLDTAEEKNEIAIKKQVGLVFQNPDNQIVASIVEEDVAFGPENLGLPPQEIRARVDEALEKVGMTEYATAAPHRLSGGQKQRVAIAGMLAMRPDCLVLDEPTAMLDPKGRQEIITTLHSLNRNEGMTVVLITHYMEEAADADRVVVMNDGGIIADGSPRDVFCEVEKLKAVGLDVPQTTELLFRLQKSGFDVEPQALSVEDTAKEIARIFGK